MKALRLLLITCTLILATTCAHLDTSIGVSGNGYSGRIGYDGKTVTTAVDLNIPKLTGLKK